MSKPSLLRRGRNRRSSPERQASRGSESTDPAARELRHLRRFFSRLSEGIYVADTEGRVLHGNRALLDFFGAESLQDLQQFRLRELVDDEDWSRRRARLEEDGELRDFRLRIEGLDGESRVALETAFPEHGPDGEVVEHHGILKAVPEGDARAQEDRGGGTSTRVDDSLERRLAIQEALATASRQLVTEATPDLEAILGELGAVAGTERAFIFQLRDGGKRMDNTHEWCRAGTESRKPVLQQLETSKYPWWMERLDAGENIVVPDVAALPAEASVERSALHARGVRSCLLVPLRSVSGELLGFTGFENFEERYEWSDADVQALRVVSEMLGSHVERGRAREALREHEMRLGLLSDQVPAVVWTTDPDLTLTSAIGSGLATLGLDGRQAEGERLQDFLPMDPSDGDLVRAHRKALEGEVSTLEREWEERYLQIQVKPFRDPDDEIVGTIGLALDITQHKLAEKTNRRQERFLAALVDSNPLGIVAISSEDRVVSCNPAFEELFGWSQDEAVGEQLNDLIVPESKMEMADDLSQQVHEGSLVRCETRRQRRDGSLVDVDIYGVPVVVDDEQIGIYAIYKDISDRKRKERQVRSQLQRQSALRNISAAITSTLDLDQTLKVLLDQIIHKLNADAVAILLTDEDSPQTLRFAKGRGFETAALRHTRLQFGEGFAGRAAQKRCIVQIEDLDIEPGDLGRAPLLEEEGFRTYFAAPVMNKGKVEGVLEIFYRDPFDGEEAWLEFLEALATQAAIAIDNARLFDDLQQSHIELQEAYDQTLEGWSRALELRDQETEGHARRVTEMTVHLATVLGLDGEEIEHLRRGALLHDIGKMAIPDSILLKPGKLNDEEWAVMRKHPTYAYDLLKPIDYLKPALEIPHYHHEKWDGSGYPEGLRGKEIPMGARIFAIIDVWDALRSDRPYREAWSREKTTEYVREQAGSHFDPKVVEAFLENDVGY